MTTRRLFVGTVVSSGVLAWLGGCAHQPPKPETIDQVLRDFRGTDAWNRSSAAFKQIMRNYVHGTDTSLSDEELDQHFEAFITLEKSDVDRFIADQSCVPASHSQPARYYLANATHQRHDAHYAKDPAHPLTGSGDGSQTLHATFSANMLLERHALTPNSEFPARMQLKGNPFTDWASIQQALGDRARFGELFHFQNPAQAEQVFAATQAIDWSQGSAELFIAPDLEGGVFSPALFAVILLRPRPTAAISVYLTVSANAGGAPQTAYVGLLAPKREEAFDSFTGFTFTYLTTKTNLLDYALVMIDEASLSFELWITTAFPEHGDTPYLTVKTAIVPAVSEAAVESFTKIRASKLIMMIRKGALMRDLIAAYYPDASELQLWEDVGAITGDADLKRRLEAAGLTLAASLFERNLWLERPVVRPSEATRPPAFEDRPGMAMGCRASSR